MLQNKLYDVVIIGGGPAGLSAALILSRCLRTVLVFDTGKPRNFKAKSMNGFISRDGTNPLEFLRITREQLLKYKVDIQNREIIKARKIENNSFEVVDRDGNTYYSKKILIATGLVDDIPDIKNIEKFYGTSVHHCPYCDGWEVRLKPLAVVSKGLSGTGLALMLSNWSDDIILCTNGMEITKDEEARLALKNIKINSAELDRIEGENGMMERLYFKDGTYIDRSALFFTTDQYQRSNIAAQLGCEFTKKGAVKTNRFQQTTTSGVFVAGDASKDVQLVIMAASEGARAAVVINKSLMKEQSNLKSISSDIKLQEMKGF